MEVQSSLFNFDKKMRTGQDQLQKNVEKLKSVAKDHNVKVRETQENNF